jgi:hypothetical protein
VNRLLEPRVVAVALGAAIAALAVAGAVYAWESPSWLSRFDLDEERTVPAFFTAFLLVACAAVALRLPRALVSRPFAIAFAALLVLASLDELVEVHERLERRLDVDWQVLYIPVFVAAAAVLGLFMMALRRNGLGLGLVLASGACWVGAQLLEAFQWEDDGAGLRVDDGGRGDARDGRQRASAAGSPHRVTGRPSCGLTGLGVRIVAS